MSFTAACIQTCATTRLEENLRNAADLTRQAAGRGARLIVLPENVSCLAQTRADKLAEARGEDAHPAIPLFSGLAKDLRVTLVAGSISITAAPEKMFNRCYVFGPDGGILAHYDKIHLYDANIGAGEVYAESDLIMPGRRAVHVQTPPAHLGLTLCYDLRFPELFRKLALAGTEVLTLPAAFTVPTGLAHWHVLLRARAIETGCFVLAAAQGGAHECGRRTFGHSLIVSPWGEVLAEKNGDAPGIITAEIDLAKVAEARSRIASLRHGREFALSQG